MSEVTLDSLRIVPFREIEAKTKERTVFAINLTKGTRRGQVLIAVPKPNGVGNDSLVIPPTFIPVELTAQVSKRQLMEAPDFRRAVANKLIALVDTDEAIKYLDSEEARDEQQRLVDQQLMQRTAMTATSVDDIKLEGESIESITERANKVAASSTGEDTFLQDGKIDGITATVMQTLEMLKESGNEKGTIATLRSAGELSKEDYKYIMTSVSKEYKDLIDWARTQYNKLKG